MIQILVIAVLLFQTFLLLRFVLPIFPTTAPSALATVTGFSFQVTEPVIAPVRRKIPQPPGMAGFGIAELLVLFGTSILVQILLNLG